MLEEKQKKAMKHVIALVNFVLDAIVGAEPGWHLINGKRWSLIDPSESSSAPNAKAKIWTLGSPPCVRPKVAQHVTNALKAADLWLTGPTRSEISGCYYWSIQLPLLND